uniref:Uncharacterized protein n=1 Tax=viral metagenome TaxID=1070528 RepID=A0A6C0HRJ1_9ZZZZ
MEISNTIALVNSSEFINLNIEEKIKNIYSGKNIIFNDILTHELCSIYRKKYRDLSRYNDENLRKHWVKYGINEGRNFLVPVYNIYFDYKPNDEFISHGKWLYFLNKINYSKYQNVILTNDSFIITRSLINLKMLVDSKTEIVSLLDSNQTQYHYPDFLRIYNFVGVNKIIKYYQENKSKITDFLSVINIFEIDSSSIFESTKVLYKMDTYDGNIHFDDDYLEDYLYNKNYPIVKVKKLMSNFYVDKNIPSDFDVEEYKSINADLVNLPNDVATDHFEKHGMNEGRLYKKNQNHKMPIFLQNYMNLIGFNI